ncbi:DUF2306 domain-containing protein [Wenxinia marina]|uniref:Putative membrane protein n=1 Tax=Wenxinia marina DSM 24838 TaxID=1123501 RepID=A0A0D0Q6Y2_9RHOB|nr:DUF2306 domain-containing protein [Wenxinia marina]KIQ70169.1 putative membrane protein [Wenxinia marina DSM 24838]GGL50869.1 membrane protein [Wenxinia marina]
MSLDPILTAPAAVQVHVAFALAAMALGPVVLLRRHRDGLHRALGRVWVGAMAGTALTSFLILEIRLIGPLSPIHLLSAWTLWGLWEAVRAARARDIARHRAGMRSLYVGAMGIAGLFTLLPGRRMHAALFGDAGMGAFLLAALALALALLLLRPGRVGA